MIATPADDEFHPPTEPDPFWSETCWWTFTVPERRLSGQLYPFFRPNQGVMASGVYFWDDTAHALWSCRYAKNFWHLPIPDEPLSDITCPNGDIRRNVSAGQFVIVELVNRREALVVGLPHNQDLTALREGREASCKGKQLEDAR